MQLAALLCCRSTARSPLLFFLSFPKAFTNKPVSALQPCQATALPHGWPLRLCPASHACAWVQRTLRGRLIKSNQTTSSIGAHRWAALGMLQRGSLAQKVLCSRRQLTEHPVGTHAAGALHPTGSPRKMLTNHEWMFDTYDWARMRLWYEQPRVESVPLRTL